MKKLLAKIKELRAPISKSQQNQNQSSGVKGGNRASESKSKTQESNRKDNKKSSEQIDEEDQGSKTKGSKGKTSKRKAEQNLSESNDLEALGGTFITEAMKRVRKNDQNYLVFGEMRNEHLVALGKKKEPATSTNRRVSTSGKEITDSKESIDQEPQETEKKPIKKKVQGTRKRIATEEESVTTTAKETMRILSIRVETKGRNFTIWRTIRTTDGINLTKMARIIVASMGWMGHYHWMFKFDGMEIHCPPEDEKERVSNVLYADQLTLESYCLKPGDKFQFIYGEGHKWDHEVVVEDLEEINPRESTTTARHAGRRKLIDYAVVENAYCAVPNDEMSKEEFEKIVGEYENGEVESAKWKSNFGDNYDIMKVDKEGINDKLKIYLYDDSMLEAHIRESDQYFPY